MVTDLTDGMTGFRVTLGADDGRAVLTVPEAGKLLGLSKNPAYSAAARGEIPTIRIGRKLVVPKAALARLLAGEG
jgi:excisionase family DNA binding protein